jgi:hypothetical protein
MSEARPLPLPSPKTELQREVQSDSKALSKNQV